MDDINGPGLHVKNEDPRMVDGYDPAASTETFPEAHPMSGIRREPSSALTMDSDFQELSPAHHADFPVPSPAGGLRPAAGAYDSHTPSPRLSGEGRGVGLQDHGPVPLR